MNQTQSKPGVAELALYSLGAGAGIVLIWIGIWGYDSSNLLTAIFILAATVGLVFGGSRLTVRRKRSQGQLTN